MGKQELIRKTPAAWARVETMFAGYAETVAISGHVPYVRLPRGTRANRGSFL